jgi:hypothetical protein
VGAKIASDKLLKKSIICYCLFRNAAFHTYFPEPATEGGMKFSNKVAGADTEIQSILKGILSILPEVT